LLKIDLVDQFIFEMLLLGVGKDNFVQKNCTGLNVIFGIYAPPPPTPESKKNSFFITGINGF